MWEDDEGVGQQREELVAYYALQELVWHLCEVMFVELLPSGCLIQQLLEWVQRNASKCTPPTNICHAHMCMHACMCACAEHVLCMCRACAVLVLNMVLYMC